LIGCFLDESISETNWSQGHMKLGTLEHMLGIIIRNQKVLGIDICGECDTNMPLPEYMEDEEKNGELNLSFTFVPLLVPFLCSWLCYIPFY